MGRQILLPVKVKRGDVLAFLDVVCTEAAAANVRVRMLAREHIGDTIGEFDEAKRWLTVCALDRNWVTTLAHEFSHMRQWIEKWPGYGTSEEDLPFFKWIEGKRNLSSRTVLTLVRRIQRCELDAERRTIRLIRDFNLDDVDNYTRRANFYVWAHEVARRHRRWIAVSDELAAKMPKKLISVDQIGSPPPDIAIP